jgi:hypothetical protein
MIKNALKEILLGATTFDMAQDAFKMKWNVEQALMLVSIGDMLGVPVASFYRLRLIPYFLPRIRSWKTAVLKEKDIINKIFS